MTDYHKRKKTFQKLMKACQEQDAYSVQMMCTKANISYTQIQAWAQEDQIWDYALDMCKSICLSNIEIAVLMKRMPLKELLHLIKDIINLY